MDYGESIDKPKPGSREGPFNVFAPAAATLVLRCRRRTWCSVLVESATRHLNANKSRIVSFLKRLSNFLYIVVFKCY